MITAIQPPFYIGLKLSSRAVAPGEQPPPHNICAAHQNRRTNQETKNKRSISFQEQVKNSINI